ncbi:MAG: fluoride efflux transporter CrcB [Planctomycetes bacterium]|nr:fluoride efflux transporter CrcB [Planctomycetota bacterium]
MTPLLSVCAGGALGSGARYLVSLFATRQLPTGFAWGTLIVNVVGSFLLAFLVQLALSSPSLTPNTRLFLTTGVLGGFTTYSTFNQETLTLLQQGSPGAALANVLATLVLGLAAGFAGFALARTIAGA